MAINTVYNPVRLMDLENSKLNCNIQGISNTIIAGTTVTSDYSLTDDCLLTNLDIISNNGVFGDYICFQIIDSEENIINEFIINYFVLPAINKQFNFGYPIKLTAGLILRIIYTSIGESNVFLGINFGLHTILI